jgi:hypothetical protein
VPAEVAFDYLADPVNRPAWQSSQRRVDDRDPGELRVGLRWTDVTWPGLRPRMEIMGHDRPRYWAERGTWRRTATAWLALEFHPRPEGCLVGATFAVEFEPRVLRRLGPLVTYLAQRPVHADLVRASRVLATRQ